MNYYTFTTVTRHVPQTYPSTMTTATALAKTNAGKKKFPCEKCDSSFSRKGGLVYHEKNQCGQPPRFKCPYCDYCTSHSSNTRRHIRKCHSDQVVFVIDLVKQKATEAKETFVKPETSIGEKIFIPKNDETRKSTKLAGSLEKHQPRRSDTTGKNGTQNGPSFYQN